MTVPSSVPFILGILVTTAGASVIALFAARDGTQTWDILKLALQGIGALRTPEYAPEPSLKKKDVVWFALDDDRPLFALRRSVALKR
jgi:hypothetical protein